MANSYFQFKQFTIYQDRCAMKVTTDACLFGAWIASEIRNQNPEIQHQTSGIGHPTPYIRHVLDIGTGTALLSLMFAQKSISAIDAIEIDDSTYEQAKENVTDSPFSEKINVIHSDIKTFSFSRKYDLIISNPPFYEKEIRSDDERKNVAHHQSGLLLEELITIIKENLNTEGNFYLLLPFKRNEEIKKILFKQDLFVSKIVFVKQTSKHNYFRLMLKGNLKKEETSETLIEEISISNNEQQYTEEFKKLLKDYYLHL